MEGDQKASFDGKVWFGLLEQKAIPNKAKRLPDLSRKRLSCRNNKFL